MIESLFLSFSFPARNSRTFVAVWESKCFPRVKNIDVWKMVRSRGLFLVDFCIANCTKKKMKKPKKIVKNKKKSISLIVWTIIYFSATFTISWFFSFPVFFSFLNLLYCAIYYCLGQRHAVRWRSRCVGTIRTASGRSWVR